MNLLQSSSKSAIQTMAKDLSPRPITDKDPVHARVLSSVADTGNAVLAKKAATDLNG